MERWTEVFNSCMGEGMVAEKMDGFIALLHIEGLL
jgi:hypothetical protein